MFSISVHPLHLAISGCTPFDLCKAARELVGTARVEIEEADIVLVQDYIMAAYQLKALALLGGTQPKTPALNCKHSRLVRPLVELQQWGQKKLLVTLGPRQNRAQE